VCRGEDAPRCWSSRSLPFPWSTRHQLDKRASIRPPRRRRPPMIVAPHQGRPRGPPRASAHGELSRPQVGHPGPGRTARRGPTRVSSGDPRKQAQAPARGRGRSGAPSTFFVGTCSWRRARCHRRPRGRESPTGRVAAGRRGPRPASNRVPEPGTGPSWVDGIDIGEIDVTAPGDEVGVGSRTVRPRSAHERDGLGRHHAGVPRAGPRPAVPAWGEGRPTRGDRSRPRRHPRAQPRSSPRRAPSRLLVARSSTSASSSPQDDLQRAQRHPPAPRARRAAAIARTSHRHPTACTPGSPRGVCLASCR